MKGKSMNSQSKRSTLLMCGLIAVLVGLFLPYFPLDRMLIGAGMTVFVLSMQALPQTFRAFARALGPLAIGFACGSLVTAWLLPITPVVALAHYAAYLVGMLVAFLLTRVPSGKPFISGW